MTRTRPVLRRTAAAVGAGSLALGLAGCQLAGAEGGGGDDADVVTIGYQSKTINTVTAGTLLRERGFFEEELEKVDPDLEVDWQDYDTGAPITAQMLAGKIDIGSMGDYPLLINGSRAGTGEGGDSMVAVTGYNLEGALNGVVAGADSDVETLEDLEGGTISASVGSAGHGTLVQALEKAGIDPNEDVSVENQDPPVGASALQAGSVDGVAQFVAWPALLAFRDDARLVYDGGRLEVPTLHGTVVRNDYVAENEEVVRAFLTAQQRATEWLHDHPVEAAEIVAEETGLPVEVVYLYNGRGGVSTFDTSLKEEQVAALEQDVPFLESIGVLEDPVDVGEFVDDSLVREVWGDDYDQAAGDTANPAAITGRDEVCGTQVTDPDTAGEVWVQGEDEPRPVADPACLLRNVAAAEDDGETVRASYVQDATTGTRWFADRMIWVQDGEELLPFATRESADEYLDEQGSAEELTWEQALEAAAR